MKSFLICILTILFFSCSTGVVLTVYDKELDSDISLDKVGIISIDGSAYPMYHNIYSLKNINFSELSLQALEKAITKEMKNIKIAYSASINAAVPAINDEFKKIKGSFKDIDEKQKKIMYKAYELLGTQYFFVLESISIKDVSSSQMPQSMLAGACIQLWDFKEGKIIYRARSTSRTIKYGEKDLKENILVPLTDLFCDLISPLPNS